MPEQEYRYDAFISYRHVEPDRRWAKWLHKTLETYKVPHRLAEQGCAAGITRVFRDEEELPASADLSSQIEDALRRSRFLIVVCSPRLVESRWCNAEVQAFHDLGRSHRILALLIEGDPSESFAPALREVRRVVVDETGSESVVVDTVEPLAADVRPIDGESDRLRRNFAKLRLLASILDCEFDDLRQRHLERQQQRTRSIVTGLAALVACLLTLTGWALFERNGAVAARDLADYQKSLAEDARDEADRQKHIVLLRQRELLQEKYQTQIGRANLALNSERFPEALQAALQALEVVEELDTNSSEVCSLLQQTVDANRLITQLKPHTATINVIDFSPDDRFLLTTSGSEAVVWDTRDWRAINEFRFPLLTFAYFSRSEPGQLVVGQVQEADNHRSFILRRVVARSGRIVAEAVYRDEIPIVDHRYPRRYQSHLLLAHDKWFDEPQRKFTLCSVETSQRLQGFALPATPLWFDVVTCGGEEVAVFADSEDVRAFRVKSADLLWTADTDTTGYVQCWTLPGDGVMLTKLKKDDQHELVFRDLISGSQLQRLTGDVAEMEFFVDRQRRLHYHLPDNPEKKYLPEQIRNAVPIPEGLPFSTRFVMSSAPSCSYVCASWSSLTLHHDQLDFRLELPIHLPSLHIATLSHDGQVLVAADSHDRLHVVDTSLDFEMVNKDSLAIRSFETLGGGRMLAVTADGELACLDPEGADRAVRVEGYLAEGNQNIRWNVIQPSQLLKVESAEEFNYISFDDTPPNPILLTIYYARTGRMLLQVPGSLASEIAPDGRSVVVMSLQKQHTVYSLDGSRQPHSIFNDRLRSLPYGWQWKYSSDSQSIVAVSADGIVEIFDVATGKSLKQFRFHPSFGETSVNEMLLSPRGRWALVDVAGSKKFVIDLKSESTREITKLNLDSLSGTFYHDESLLVVDDGIEERLTFWQWPSMVRKFEIRGDVDSHGILFFGNGTMFLSDEHGNGVLAQQANGEVIQRFDQIDAVSNDGSMIAFGREFETVIFDLKRRRIRRRLPFMGVYSAGFSQDDKSLYLALGDGGLVKCAVGGSLENVKRQAQQEAIRLHR